MLQNIAAIVWKISCPERPQDKRLTNQKEPEELGPDDSRRSRVKSEKVEIDLGKPPEHSAG